MTTEVTDGSFGYNFVCFNMNLSFECFYFSSKTTHNALLFDNISRIPLDGTSIFDVMFVKTA